MNLVSHTVDVSAPASVVWNKLVRWEEWPCWDTGMEKVTFDGPICVGSIGRLKLTAGPQVLLHVSSMNEGEWYTDYFDHLGTRFVFYHDVTVAADGLTRVHFSAEAEGLTAWFLGNLIMADVGKKLPQWLGNFKRHCEASLRH